LYIKIKGIQGSINEIENKIFVYNYSENFEENNNTDNNNEDFENLIK
jgi:hypothetical protein